MKKILSGQAFLYRRGGYDSTVVEVEMDGNVTGSYLQRALSEAIIRYPYFSSKFVEKNGSFYLEDELTSMVVKKTDKYRALGSMETGYHLIDVTYTENKIRVSFHHALCDGRGIKPFVETLVYYYCCYKFKKNFTPVNIRTADSELLPGEIAEPYENGTFEIEQFTLPLVVREGYALPENAADLEEHFRYDISIEQDSITF